MVCLPHWMAGTVTLPGLHHDTSLAMKASRHWTPCLSQGNHRTCVQDTEAEEMIEFQAHAVHGPLESVFGIEQRISLWCQYSQVLDVSPRQRRTATKMKEAINGRSTPLVTKLVSLIVLTWLPMQGRKLPQPRVQLPKFPNVFSCTFHTSQL